MAEAGSAIAVSHCGLAVHCFHIMVSDRYTDWRETKLVADNIGQD